MSKLEAWQTAEVAGPKKALPVTKPEVVLAMVKRAKRPILIVGHKASEEELEKKKLIDYMLRMARCSKITTIATAHTIKDFLEKGFEGAYHMPLVDIINRVKDPDWKGLDEKGQYDLVMIVGLPYYMEWLVLNSLKHFTNTTTISLERRYQPNATWSFPNISIKDWTANLDKIVEGLEAK
jgi:acetyl-CoA decarbonylase/synthase complex subunit epsilon